MPKAGKVTLESLSGHCQPQVLWLNSVSQHKTRNPPKNEVGQKWLKSRFRANFESRSKSRSGSRFFPVEENLLPDLLLDPTFRSSPKTYCSAILLGYFIVSGISGLVAHAGHHKSCLEFGGVRMDRTKWRQISTPLRIGNGVGKQDHGNQPPYRRYGPDTEFSIDTGSHTDLQNPSRIISKREADTKFQYRRHIVQEWLRQTKPKKVMFANFRGRSPE